MWHKDKGDKQIWTVWQTTALFRNLIERLLGGSPAHDWTLEGTVEHFCSVVARRTRNWTPNAGGDVWNQERVQQATKKNTEWEKLNWCLTGRGNIWLLSGVQIKELIWRKTVNHDFSSTLTFTMNSAWGKNQSSRTDYRHLFTGSGQRQNFNYQPVLQETSRLSQNGRHDRIAKLLFFFISPHTHPVRRWYAELRQAVSFIHWEASHSRNHCFFNFSPNIQTL